MGCSYSTFDNFSIRQVFNVPPPVNGSFGPNTPPSTRILTSGVNTGGINLFGFGKLIVPLLPG